MQLIPLLECIMKERRSKDVEKALNLYQFAADHGDQEAAKNIEIIKRIWVLIKIY